MKHLLLMLLGGASLLFSCRNTYTIDEYYSQWLKPGLFTATKGVGQLEFSATYLSPEYQALTEFGSDLSKGQLDSVLGAKDRDIQFSFRIKGENGMAPLQSLRHDHARYSELVNYLSGPVEKDFRLIANHSDTIACDLSLFERSYGGTPYHSILVSFNKPSTISSLVFHYNDQVFGAGPVNIPLNTDLLLNPPQLKLEK